MRSVGNHQVTLLMQRETENQNNFEHVYTLLDLDEPSARSIRDLETIMGEPACAVCIHHGQTLRPSASLPRSKGLFGSVLRMALAAGIGPLLSACRLQKTCQDLHVYDSHDVSWDSLWCRRGV